MKRKYKRMLLRLKKRGYSPQFATYQNIIYEAKLIGIRLSDYETMDLCELVWFSI